MTTQALQHFIQVYENGSLSAAAKKNFITPQGLSKAIRQIEQEFNIKLFLRKGNKLMATQEGHLMYKKAVEMINIVRDLNVSFAKGKSDHNMLRMVVSQSASRLYSPTYLTETCDQLLKIKEVSEDHDIEDYIKLEYDYGLFAGDCRKYEAYHKKKLKSGQMVVIIPDQHDFSEKKAISLDALRGRPLVLHAFGSKDKHIFIEKCLANGFKPEIVQEVIRFESGIHLCQRENYMMITSDFMAETCTTNHCYKAEIYPRIPHNIYLIANPHRVSETLFLNLVNQLERPSRQQVRVQIPLGVSL